MKIKISLILFTILLGSCSTKPAIKNKNIINNSNSWTSSDRTNHLKNIQDSTTWDYQLLKTDKQLVGLGDFGPFELGAFPVPEYDILGKESFKGIGNKSGEFQVNDKTLIMDSFFVEKNELNKNRLNDKKDDVFFQIIVLTDTTDNENYAIHQSAILSRNHPDYLGQGFIKTKSNRIDYLAFQTAENDAFAIVNTRLFNLNFGRTILIAPQKDKTLRSLQIKSPQVTSNSIKELTKDLINQEEIIQFFEKEGNI